MDRLNRYRNRVLIGLLFGFGVVILTALLSDVNALAAQAVAFPWLLMLPVLALRVLNWALRFLKWHFYLHLVGARGLSVEDSAAIFISGFPLSLSPGKAAEFLKTLIIKGMTGTPIATTVPVVAAERMSDGIAVLFLLAVSIGAVAADQYWPVVLVSLAVFATVIAVLQVRPLCLWLLDRAAGLPLVRRFADPLRTLYESSYAIVRWRSILIAVGLGALANLLDGLGVWLILVGSGQQPTLQLFFEALLVISLSVVVGSVSALPGGLGAADLSIGVTMQLIVGLSAATAGFVTLLARFVQLWWGVLVGVVVGWVYRRRLLGPLLAAQSAEPAAAGAAEAADASSFSPAGSASASSAGVPLNGRVK